MKDINEILRNTSSEIGFFENQTTPSNESEKETGQWTGKVVENDDPLHIGRCKIRVFGYYDNLKTAQIPWAIMESSYLGSTNGNLVVPEIGTIVRGYFDVGDTQKPIFSTTITKLDSLVKSQTKLSRVKDYPETMVLLETDQGESLTLNRKSGAISFNHRSGTSFNIAPNGSIKIDHGPINLSSLTSTSSDSKPTFELIINGECSIKAKGDVTVESDMNVDIKSVRGQINLGNNRLKQLVCTQPVCFVTGAPLNGGNTQVKA